MSPQAERYKMQRTYSTIKKAFVRPKSWQRLNQSKSRSQSKVKQSQSKKITFNNNCKSSRMVNSKWKYFKDKFFFILKQRELVRKQQKEEIERLEKEEAEANHEFETLTKELLGYDI